MKYGDSLNSRLRNCLLTILELEGSLEHTHLGPALQKEFTVLREVMERLECVVVQESDVGRIESATNRFLAELKETLGESAVPAKNGRRLLQ